jgi:hypothetical protein
MEGYWPALKGFTCEVLIYKNDVQLVRLQLNDEIASDVSLDIMWDEIYDYELYCNGQQISLHGWYYYTPDSRIIIEQDFNGFTKTPGILLGLIRGIESYKLDGLFFEFVTNEDHTAILKLEKVSMQILRSIVDRVKCPNAAQLPLDMIRQAKIDSGIILDEALKTLGLCLMQIGIIRDLRQYIYRWIRDRFRSNVYYMIKFAGSLHVCEDDSDDEGSNPQDIGQWVYCRFCINLGRTFDRTDEEICRFCDLHFYQCTTDVYPGGDTRTIHPKFGLVHSSIYNDRLREHINTIFIPRT